MNSFGLCRVSARYDGCRGVLGVLSVCGVVSVRSVLSVLGVWKVSVEQACNSILKITNLLSQQFNSIDAFVYRIGTAVHLVSEISVKFVSRAHVRLLCLLQFLQCCTVLLNASLNKLY